MADNEVSMMMSVYPGAMTGFAALNAGLVSINNAFLSTTRAIDQNFGLVNTAIVTTGVVVAQFGMDAMEAFGKFEQGMKIVQMVSGQSKQDIQELTQVANQFSVQYRTDIDQITEGLQTLGRAGLNSAAEQTEVLEAGLTTAKLEGRELNSVLQELIQNTALLGGDLQSDQFGELSEYLNDKLVATSMTAPITTHDISETLKYSGGIAAAAGANLESDQGKENLDDYLAAIAAFARKGVTGSIAGTALRAFFNKPATQDSSVVEALASIKLKPEYLWEEDEETMKPISDQIGIIQGQMDKLNISTMDQLQIWSKIVGGKMGQQMMKLHAEDIKQVRSEIRSADDATSLAANSMKTYEANLKAVGEAGEVLKRNVGGKLVYFVNPILEVLNRIISFTNTDFMSTPIATGIIAFLGLAATKVWGVIKSLRAEISKIFNDYTAGINHYMTKDGYKRNAAGQWVRDFEKSKGSGKATPTSLAGFYNEYKNNIKESGSLTLKEFQKAGISKEATALAGHFGKLSKEVSKVGASEGKVWGSLIKNNLIPQEDLKKGISLMNAGANPRPTADALNINKYIPALMQNEKALMDLGISAERAKLMVQNYNRAEQERIAEEQFVEERIKETALEVHNRGLAEQDLKIANEKIVQTEFERAAQEEFTNQAVKETIAEITKATQAENERAAAEVFVSREIDKTIQDIYSRVPEASVRVIENTRNSTTQVVLEFEKMRAGILAAVSGLGTNIPNRMHPKTSVFDMLYNPLLRGYVQLPQNIHEMMGKDYVPYIPPENRQAAKARQQLRERRAESLKNQDTEMRAKAFQRAYNNPYIPEKTGRTKTDARIEASLRGKRLKNDFKEYNDAQTAHVNRLFQQHVENSRKIQSGYIGASGVGTIASQMPSREVANEALKAYEEATRRRVYTSRGSLSSDSSGLSKTGLVLNKNEIEKIRDDASKAAHGVRQGLMSRFLTKGSGQKTSGSIFGKSDIRNIQENARKAVESTIRRVNDAVVNAASTGLRSKGIVNRSEIDRIRKQASDEWNKNNAWRNDDPLGKAGYPSRMRSSSPDQAHSDFIKNQNKSVKNVEDTVKKGTSLNHRVQIRMNEYHKAVENRIKREIQHEQAMMQYQGARSGYYALTPEQLKEAEYIANQKSIMQRIRGSSLAHPVSAIQNTGFYTNLMGRLNADRTGRFISFGKEKMFNTETGAFMGFRSATSGVKGFANKIMNATDAVGGGFMIAIMAATFIIQKWQEAFQNYCEELKEAGDKLSDAYSKWNQAEDDLEQSYRDANPDATQSEIEDMVLETYSTMNDDIQNAWNNGQQEWFKKVSKKGETGNEYVLDEEANDGSTKIKEEEVDEAVAIQDAIKENTGALYAATAELSVAASNYARKANDPWWGLDGWTGGVTNFFGGLEDWIGHRISMGTKDVNNPFGNADGSRFSDNNEFLLTAQQKDENYAGYTEMAGLMIEDFKDAKGNWIKGMRTMMGDDVEVIKDVMSSGAQDMLKNVATNISRLSPTDNAKLQASMKNDTKTWSKLGKEIAKYEMKNNKSVGKTAKQSTKKIEGLISKLNASMSGSFSRTQILQAAYLMEMQDMYKVAQNTMVPLISQNAESVANTLLQTQGINEQTNGTGSYTSNTAAIASAIAAMVSTIAMAKSGEAYYNQLLMSDPSKLSDEEKAAYDIAQKSSNAQDFMKKAGASAYDKATAGSWGGFDTTGPIPGIRTQKDADEQNAKNQAAMAGILKNYMATAKMSVYGYDTESAIESADQYVTKALKDGVSPMDLYKTIAKNYQSPAFLDQLVAAYVANEDGEEGSSGGSGSGSGSGNKDNSGTKKERVDLVLCNKKEIPKLNVNLFKKPPSFTVLNKNFKLRDVKINTQDKPKAVMAAIKNSFIDIQKRTDPKIIQDEDAVYDPVAATEGNSTPSGSTGTKTDD